MVRPRSAGKVEAPGATTANAPGDAPAHSFAPFEGLDLPDGATIRNGDTLLFKQTGDLFKQLADHDGSVVGLMYKGPRMEAWSTLSKAQVKSRLGIYQTRSEKGEVSEAVRKGLEVWEFAIGLFGARERVVEPNLETIHET